MSMRSEELELFRASLFNSTFRETPTTGFHEDYIALSVRLSDTRTWVEFFTVLSDEISANEDEFMSSAGLFSSDLKSLRAKKIVEIFVLVSGDEAPRTIEEKRRCLEDLQTLALLWKSYAGSSDIFSVQAPLASLDTPILRPFTMTDTELFDYAKAKGLLLRRLDSMQAVMTEFREAQHVYQEAFSAFWNTPGYQARVLAVGQQLLAAQDYPGLYWWFSVHQGSTMEAPLAESLRPTLTKFVTSGDSSLFLTVLAVAVGVTDPLIDRIRPWLTRSLTNLPEAFFGRDVSEVGHGDYLHLARLLGHAQNKFSQWDALRTHMKAALNQGKFLGIFSRKHWLDGSRGEVLRKVLLSKPGSPDSTEEKIADRASIARIIEVVSWLMATRPVGDAVFKVEPSYLSRPSVSVGTPAAAFAFVSPAGGGAGAPAGGPSEVEMAVLRP
jgi:hypothetical protein